MGNFKTYDLSGHNCSHSGLFLYYRGRSVAERQERRYFGGVWRARQPNGVRSSGRGQRAFQGDDMVGRGFHDYFHHPVGIRGQTRRSEFGAAGCEIATG